MQNFGYIKTEDIFDFHLGFKSETKPDDSSERVEFQIKAPRGEY